MEKFFNIMYAFFNIVFYRHCFSFKYTWSYFLILTFKIYSTEKTLPYPNVSYSNSIQFIENQKFELNTFVKLNNSSIELLLSEDTSLAIYDAEFKLIKLPEYYVLEATKGYFLISGKKQTQFVFKDQKIIFKEGGILFSFIDDKLKLISSKTTSIDYEKEGKVQTLKNSYYYSIEAGVFKIGSRINFETDATMVLDSSIYKKLLIKSNKLEPDVALSNGLVIFCIEGNASIVGNWFVNTNKDIILKKIFKEKYLPKCKEKFSNIIDAGAYETAEENCLYINNNYCQKLRVTSDLFKISASNLIVTGYDFVYIKSSKQDFVEVSDRWLNLMPGKYTLKLGKKFQDSIIYKEKEINLEANKTLKISE